MPENEFDPQDVIASSVLAAFGRAFVFLLVCFTGHAVGAFASAFHTVFDLIPFYAKPAFDYFGMNVFGSLGVAFFLVILKWWLAPWIFALLYFASQFLFVEGGWQRWVPWVIGGQAMYSFLVLGGGGVGIVVVVGVSGAIIACWKLLEAKLYEREMQRFDSIEAENRKKRRAKNQGADSRTQ